MIFKSFFKPKWKNNNPQIRRQALRDMDASTKENQEIFQQMLRNDPDPVVRQTVLRQIRDIPLLSETSKTDLDATVREHAMQRLRRLLGGNETDSPSVDERIELLKDFDDTRLLEFLARQAKEVELREAIMLQLDKDVLYGDLALQDPDPSLRSKAVDQVIQRTTLERVLKGSRTKDKRVRLAAQEKLAAIKAEEERPDELKQQARQLCARMDSLQLALKSEPDSIRLRSQRQEIDKEWQNVNSMWKNEHHTDWDEKITERYQRACETIDQLLVGYAEQAERIAEQERSYEPIRQEKERIYAELSDQLRQLENTENSALNDSVLQALQDVLVQSEKSWYAAGDLSAEEARKTNQAFKDLTNKLHRRAEDISLYLKAADVCGKIIHKIETKLNKKPDHDERFLQGVEKQWAEVKRPVHLKLPDELLHQTQALLEKLRKTKQKTERAREKAFDAFVDNVNALEKALNEGQSKRASSLARQLNNNLKALHNTDVKRLKETGDYARYLRATGQLKELKDWQGWASNPLREQLCQEAEALAEEVENCGVNQNYDFHAASKKIQNVRQRWKSLGAMEGEHCEEQWERFNAACNRAYEPCQKFFDMEAQQREQNLEAKQALCGELEVYFSEHIDGKDESTIDWKRLDRTISTALQNWRNIGPVRRKDHTSVRDRFNQVLQALKTVVQAERERNKLQKEALILNAEKIATALAESDKSPQTLRDSASAIKLLQASWKEVGYAAEEKKLWKRFRAACDSVFNERQAQFDFLAEERRGNLSQKETLCELIERMSELQGEELKNARSRVEEIKAEWKEAGEVPQDQSEAIERRFQKACRAYQNALKLVAQEEVDAERQALYMKHELCVQLELLVDELLEQQVDTTEVVSRLESIKSAWQEALAHEQDAVAAALLERFEHGLSVLEQLINSTDSRDEIMPMLREVQILSLEKKKAWCLALEILAGVDSPADVDEERMALQVQMLAQKHGQDVDVDRHLANSVTEIENQWFSTRSPAALETVQLERRFAQARQALLSKTSPGQDGTTSRTALG